MKVRTDFVTNSSSVSYIITLKKDMVENCLNFRKGTFKDGEDKIVETIKNHILKNGTKVYIEDEEIYTYKIKFHTNYTTDNSSLELTPAQADFSSMDEETLWEYIYGEYILKGHLNIIDGFGITQTESY